MSDKRSFANKYGIKFMLLGFSIIAIGAVGNVTVAATWSTPVLIAGLVVYAVGRTLQVLNRREKR